MYTKLNPLALALRGAGKSSLPSAVPTANPADMVIPPNVIRAIHGKLRSVRKGGQSRFLRKRGWLPQRRGLPAKSVHFHFNLNKAGLIQQNPLLRSLLRGYVNLEGVQPA